MVTDQTYFIISFYEFSFYYFPAPVHTGEGTVRLHSYACFGSTQDKPMLYDQELSRTNECK